MSTKQLLAVVLFVVFGLFIVNICSAQEGFRTNWGTGECADLYKNPDAMKQYTYFNIGPIKTGWFMYGANDPGKNFTMPLRVPGQTPLEFCMLPEGASLEDVENPALLPYTKPGHGELTYEWWHKVNGKYVLAVRSKKPLPTNTKLRQVTSQNAVGGPIYAQLGLNQAVVFKLENAYGGFQATEIKEKTWTDIAHMGGTKPGGIMKYEWRTWVVVPIWSDKMLQQARADR